VDQVDSLVEQRVQRRLVFRNRLLMRLHLLNAVVQPESRHAESGYQLDVFVHRSSALFAHDLCLFLFGNCQPDLLRLSMMISQYFTHQVAASAASMSGKI